ncbi:enoyl-CoA hydratase/isomerase family protein [Vitreoscilla massiliensis]|uniref:Enoyl-CoA hydratase/isomerase family protein n=1 Tax=Vitreoscilla massiliensis TaxID=1689272 RepID=A0ABY4DZL1_9NEIS|nr:enoyl-CoA hydratase/isomerase family protein [Vitreoscilla massiliensis]UOO88974.1 enoyl-CoA hydratase/isomerase family protein [Vitreoscilla massiliensis]
MSETYISVEQQGAVATVWLERPEVHNAFNAALIEQLKQCFIGLNQRDDVRVVVLAGRGKSFSAGADLNWMKAAGAASEAENQADAQQLADMLYALATLKQPTIARVQGAAMGGGMGLAATCDICIAGDKAMFATSEVRLGLAPSTISPYVIRAIGERQAQRYFLTAERISAAKAVEIGLAHEVVGMDDLDAKVAEIVAALLLGGPTAQQASKELIALVAKRDNTPELRSETAAHIASVRAGQEAKEGLSAFLEKRAAAWCSTATSS